MQTTDIIVFLGPSLPLAQAKEILPQAFYLPPARFGDIFRVLRLKPKVIVIIDGIADKKSALWHKEILFALEEGVQVFGAAGIGALRAVELEESGMVGMGEIFQALKNEPQSDEDDIALDYQNATGEFTPLNETLVNIRTTILNAQAENILDEISAGAILQMARELPYAKRRWDEILRAPYMADLPKDMVAHFKRWQMAHAFNQNPIDARLLLEHVKKHDLFARPASKMAAQKPDRLNLKTLYLDVMCRPFIEDSPILPQAERIALHARLLGKEYILNRTLAYLIATATGIFDVYSIGKAHQNYEHRLKLFIEGTQPTPATYACLARYAIIFTGLSQNEGEKWAHIIDALIKAWQVLNWHIEKCLWNVTLEALQTFTNDFRIARHLFSKEATFEWIKAEQLTEDEFENMLRHAYYLDHFALKNNLEQIQIQPPFDQWWLWDALNLTGSAETAEALLMSPEKKKAQALALIKKNKAHLSDFVAQMDFSNGESEFNQFIGDLR